MRKKILVPLGQSDRVEEMIAYFDRVARPGMKVVFLMRYPVGGIRWPTKEPDRETGAEVKELLDHYCWEANVKRANAEVVPAVEALGTKGVEAAVEVYAGSLKKAIRNHALTGDVLLIMTRAGIAAWGLGFLKSAGSVFSGVRRSRLSPVLLTQVSLVH